MPAKESPHVLVIDDSPEELRALQNVLRGHGYRVTLATDGRQGFQRALALQPDLILLDVRMPALDGFATCRLLKEAPRTQDIPVIFLSSAGALEERLEGLGHGGVDYVLKPCHPDEVLARVRIHLQLRPRPAEPAADEPEAFLSQDEIMLRAAVRLISEQLASLPSLEDIARKVGTHDKRLSAVFRQHMGTTVFAWIREERLRKGRMLLMETSLSLQDVAESVGFRSACNFITAFRERMGVTPNQFRKASRADALETVG
ncbi:Helix-turn-helix domain-containing protein [Dyella sp. OK004]|uniref:response regulator transcription factor n=1 Tax=Dyella sp. OK004 TaxID=1855292 RepID=UPI0008F3888B|nr:response regulator [Dyella sp. OK004]SFS20112.1 Helix-turn-helix domain-containing protein [Dyella sp. OK004]